MILTPDPGMPATQPNPTRRILPQRRDPRPTGPLLALVLILALAFGCSPVPSQRPSAQLAAWTETTAATRPDLLTPPAPVAAVEAVCVPPAGWRAEPLKKSSSHSHQVWLSPTGDTAYGVIRFSMPLPVGEDLALVGFLNQMKSHEGEANLLSKERDPNLPGLRFVAEGGLYTIRTNLIVSGWGGWAIYAGTLRKHPVRPEELDLAEAARESTRVGLPGPGK